MPRAALPRVREAAARALEDAIDFKLVMALAEPTRQRILAILLRLGPSDIGVIAQQVTQDRSVVSRHLKQLLAAGLVRLRKDGRHSIYSLDGAAMVGRLEDMAATIRRCMVVCCPEQIRELDR